MCFFASIFQFDSYFPFFDLHYEKYFVRPEHAAIIIIIICLFPREK